MNAPIPGAAPNFSICELRSTIARIMIADNWIGVTIYCFALAAVILAEIDQATRHADFCWIGNGGNKFLYVHSTLTGRCGTRPGFGRDPTAPVTHYPASSK